jgi:hypothetical protein
VNKYSERQLWTGASGHIEVLIDLPANNEYKSSEKGWAFIAHPHPLFGGSMDNKVVQTLARAFVASGWRTLRFNFRGVGQSQGVHDQGVGETADLIQIIGQCAPSGPIALAGFSFGAFVASHVVQEMVDQGRGGKEYETQSAPRDLKKIVLVGTATTRFDVCPLANWLHPDALVIHGEQDETVALSSVMNWARPQSLPITVVPGGEHFFHGQLPLLKSLVTRHLKD